MIIDGVAQIIDNATTNVVMDIYKSTNWLFTAPVTYTIIALFACLWVWNKIGREWSREDFYKAGSWIIMFVCLQAIYFNENTYKEFLNLIHLPVNWFYNAVGQKQASANVDDAIEYSVTLAQGIWNHISITSLYNGEALLFIILGLLVLGIIWLYALFLIFFIIFVSVVSIIVLAVCPILLKDCKFNVKTLLKWLYSNRILREKTPTI